MSVILCRWLNQELRLSKAVDPRTFARDFSSGYLIGEILHKHQIQHDFSMFLKMDTSISKVNNFTRLKPTLELLGICLDTNTVQDLMQEKPGVATHLLYELYLSLEKKNNSKIRRTIMKPTAKANLLKEEHGFPQVANCDVKLKLQETAQHYGDKCQQLIAKSVVAQPIQHMGQLKVQDEKQIENSEKMCHEKYNVRNCNLVAKAQVTKPPSHPLPPNIRRRKQHHKEQQAQKDEAEIDKFETNRKKLGISGFPSSSSSSVHPLPVHFPPGGSKQECKRIGIQPIVQSNNMYIEEIRQRLRENAAAREQREKRKDRFLVEWFKASKAQQETQQEEQLVQHLTCKAKWEQHLVAQLMQIRTEKEIIVEARLVREHQYQEQREKDFQKTLCRDAVKQDE
ncbi:sperm flagellar protein 2-like [Melanotaenia boesemani]|uniref:sperm flagellar protein 2-like n=1 Tax=Melanotaenia boesemani TaxID=1250792 RepID=UPI001C04D1D3|nr:sperm flagellar protein 2-like [Melanotaenia boesemani]